MAEPDGFERFVTGRAAALTRFGYVLAGNQHDTGMWSALATLGPRQRAVLVLRYYDGLGDEQIAERLHISAATVRSHASRALRTLRERVTAAGVPIPPQRAERSRRHA
jgi:DNA-binding NarL/FixJ family response regulator